MEEKDPPPFGYTFTHDFHVEPASAPDKPGASLLSETESQTLADFFSQTQWSADSQTFLSTSDTVDVSNNDFGAWGLVPPAVIHDISTTIPDQAQLPHFEAGNHAFGYEAPPAAAFHNTADDLRAATTLYAQAQMHPVNKHAYHFHAARPSRVASSEYSAPVLHASSLGSAADGFVDDRYVGLLTRSNTGPAASGHDTAQFMENTSTESYANRPRGVASSRPAFDRNYAYGTDTSFGRPVYRIPGLQQAEQQDVERPVHELSAAHNQASTSSISATGASLSSPSNHGRVSSDDMSVSDQAITDSDDKDDNTPVRSSKKRRTSKPSSSRPTPAKAGKHASSDSVTRVTAAMRKSSTEDRVRKKKRSSSAAAAKAIRENLTEEQKRNNHILSEQKRRNLIKRGFDDLHDLVPEIRNGGLSKSGVLLEGGNFLEDLTKGNGRLRVMLGEG